MIQLAGTKMGCVSPGTIVRLHKFVNTRPMTMKNKTEVYLLIKKCMLLSKTFHKRDNKGRFMLECAVCETAIVRDTPMFYVIIFE
jgi:hypothetical protein